nr:hypothetical protein [Mycoplasmopsis bovis]
MGDFIFKVYAEEQRNNSFAWSNAWNENGAYEFIVLYNSNRT